MALEAPVLLIALGTVLLVGWLGTLLFARTKVPDVLLLMAFGVAMGVFGRSRGVNFDFLETVTPFVGAIALITILFDGGLKLKVKDLVSGAPRATMLALLGFVLTAALIGGYVFLVLRLDFMVGVLLGAILGGTSSVVVMPVVEKLGLRRQTGTVLGLESALTDVLVVVVTITLATAMVPLRLGDGLGNATATGSPLSASLGRDIVGSFALAIVIGGFAGVVWLKALQRLSGALEYMMTLAAIFFLYGVVEIMEASGPIAVLTFGFVLGNAYRLSDKLNLESTGVTHVISRMQEEITFFVRTFFFVYLGLVLDLSALTGRFIFVALGMLVALTAARWAAVQLTSFGNKRLQEDALSMTVMMPRGLAAAVLAAVPFQAGIPGTEDFVNYAFLLIVFTNLVSTVGVFVISRRKPPAEAPGDHPAVAPE